ncbi:RacGEF [Acrasis kona]|uniref:RacGEF n=1 Tax=Acrasis kona TaxID=1008807 RepID=A0AAW2Z4A6_9EUKA
MIDTKTIIGISILGGCLLIVVILIIIAILRRKLNARPVLNPIMDLTPNRKARYDLDEVEELEHDPQNIWDREIAEIVQPSDLREVIIRSPKSPIRANKSPSTPSVQNPKSPVEGRRPTPRGTLVYNDLEDDDGEGFYNNGFSLPSAGKMRSHVRYAQAFFDNDDVWDAQVEFENEYHGNEDTLTVSSPTNDNNLSSRAKEKLDRVQLKLEKAGAKVQDGFGKFNDRVDRFKKRIKRKQDVATEQPVKFNWKKQQDQPAASPQKPVIKRKDTATDLEVATQDLVTDHLVGDVKTDYEDELAGAGQLTHRRKILFEFLHTEQSYVSTLDSLFAYFVDPLDEDPSQHGVNEKFVQACFLEIGNIREMNTTFLQQLEKIIPDNDDDATCERALSEEIIKWCAAFKLYVPYINGYQDIMRKIADKKKKSSKFRDFCLERAEVMKEARLGQLSGLMITPVQRIPRYQLLLDSLVKADALRSQSDMNRLQAALDMIKEVAEYCNEKERELESMNKMFELSKALHNKELIKPGRILMLENLNMQYEQRNSKCGACNLYLFNDLMVIQKKSSIKKPREIVIDSNVVVTACDECAFKVSTKDLLESPDQKVRVSSNAPKAKGDYLMKFICSTPQERKLWLDSIKKAIDKSSGEHSLV